MGRVLIALLLALCLAPAAFADGKVFRFGVAELPPIPDQQALICYDQQAQTQTLAIETRFRPADGPVQPYAWVVPLPGPTAPTITPATTGLFPTLRQIFQPRVINLSDPVILYVSLALAGAVILGVQISYHNRSPLITGLLLFFLCACLIGILLPALGTARSSRAGAGVGVTVLERSLVGDYEITTIAATPEAADPAKALAAWLESHGFKQPPSVAPVLADYAKRNWVFACVKLLNLPKPSPDGTLTPHPLVFTFKTPQAVYPMALTGVGNGALTLDLYIFSDGSATASGMSLVRSSKTKVNNPAESSFYSSVYRSSEVVVGHPGLKQLAAKFSCATKLSGTLSSEQQSRDLPITFWPFKSFGETKYSKAAARASALDFAGGALLISVIGLVIATATVKQEAPWFNRRLALPLLIAIVVGAGRWIWLPTVETTSFSRRDAYRQIDDLQTLGAELSGRFLNSKEAPDLNEVRRAVAEVLKEKRGTPPREEDSPWNYTLATNASGGVEFTFYDGVGQPNTFDIWVKPKQTDPKP